jgi:hypothetical protein
MKKVSLCFLISYDHILKKEEIWREWIEPNKDVINIYFHYSDYEKIQSDWIKEHALPKNFIATTSYFHVVPAYMSVLYYAIKMDTENQWFIFLTDSCAPIVSPEIFRKKFLKNQTKTIMKWKPAWWNVRVSKRANLSKLPKEYHIGNDPWFIISKEDAVACNHFAFSQTQLFNLICQGGLANESIFIIMLKKCNRLENVINEMTHAADWERMSSDTSPYVFREATNENIKWIDEIVKKQPQIMFLRKVETTFPNEILQKYCKSTKNEKDSSNIFLFTPVFPYFYLAGWIFLFILLQYISSTSIVYHNQYR